MTVLTLITLTGHKRGSESEPFTQSHSIPINAFCSLPLEMAGSNGSSLMGWINAFETFWDRTHPLKFPLQVCLRKTTMQISKPVAFTNSLSSFCSSAIIKNNKGSASSSASLCSEGGLPSWEVVQMLDIGYTWFEYLPFMWAKNCTVWTWSMSAVAVLSDNCTSIYHISWLLDLMDHSSRWG